MCMRLSVSSQMFIMPEVIWTQLESCVSRLLHCYRCKNRGTPSEQLWLWIRCAASNATIYEGTVYSHHGRFSTPCVIIGLFFSQVGFLVIVMEHIVSYHFQSTVLGNLLRHNSFKQERLKHRHTLGCLDQYAAQISKYDRLPIPSQPPTQKVFFQWRTQYDSTKKPSHCETAYAKELFQWLLLELAYSLRNFSILPTYKLAGLTKECQWWTQKAQFGLGLKSKIEFKINFNQAQNR